MDQLAAQDRTEQRHQKELEFVTGLLEKGYKLKVLRADPRFNGITDAEWNTFAEGERLRNEQQKREEQKGAALGTGGFEGLAAQGADASEGTTAQKRAFGERLQGLGALNDPNKLNQIAGALDAERGSRAKQAAGQSLDQLGKRAVAVDAEGRELATKIAAENRAQATPQKQWQEVQAKYFLGIARGDEPDENIARAIQESAKLDPVRAWLAGQLAGGEEPQAPKNPGKERAANRAAFKEQGLSKEWKEVKPDPKVSFETDAARAGKLIVENRETGVREVWRRGP